MSHPSIIPRLASVRLTGGPLDGVARQVIFRLLGKMQQGRLTLWETGRVFSFGEPVSQAALQATVTVHHPRFSRSLLLAGSRGLGEAYVAGWWSADDLTRVICILSLNLQLLEGSLRRRIRLAAPFYRFLQRPFRNTLAGSRANIAAHYDLGNDFYALFLDETLTYSCGIFEKEDSTLKEASLAKYDRICRKLALAAGDHVLEIGSGWGGFAIHAASPAPLRKKPEALHSAARWRRGCPPQWGSGATPSKSLAGPPPPLPFPAGPLSPGAFGKAPGCPGLPGGRE